MFSVTGKQALHATFFPATGDFNTWFLVQALENLCDSVGQTAHQKEEQLSELLQLSDNFSQRKDTLVKTLQQVETRIAAAKVKQSSLQGIRDLISEIEVSCKLICIIHSYNNEPILIRLASFRLKSYCCSKGIPDNNID